MPDTAAAAGPTDRPWTPGPWRAWDSENPDAVGAIWYLDVGSDPSPNGNVATFWSYDGRSPADATLAASAPDLFEALAALRNECSGKPRPDQLARLLPQADAAMAKALGKAAT